MKSCYLLVIVLSFITLALGQAPAPAANDQYCQFSALEPILCNNKTNITDQQCTDVLAKCPCDKQSVVSYSYIRDYFYLKLISKFTNFKIECIVNFFYNRWTM